MTDRDRLLARLLAQRGIELAEEPRIPRRSPDATVPLSGAQRGLWFTERMGLDQGAYVMPMVLRLAGDLDVAALRRALRKVLRRHEALRTYVVERDGVPEQRVASLDELSEEDYFTLVDGEPDGLLAEAVDRPFDLARAPFLRVLLIRRAPAEHVLVLAAHHIVCDHDSVNQLYAELVSYYDGAELPELPLQFPDYVRWQEDQLDAGARDKQLAHWRERLADAPPVLNLPTDRPRTASRGVAGASHTLTVPAELAARFTALCRAHGCTTFAGLLAAFGLLLGRYSGSTDVVIGSPTTRRPSQMDGVVGLFVTPTAMRVDLSGAPTVPELLARARDVAADALSNADVSFDQVAAAVAPRRDLSYHPLFQVMLVQNRDGEPVRWPGLTVTPVAVGRATSRFDLTLQVRERVGAWPVDLDYSADLFDRDTMVRLGTHFVALLTAMVDHPTAPVAALDLSTEDDRDLLARLNDTEQTYPPADSVVDLIETQAQLTPDAPAVLTVAGETVTYRELDERANALATSLRDRGVGPEIPVGLRMRASPDAIVALLGILKAGGYYVPLDPGWPDLRLLAILDDCGATVVLSDEDLAGGPSPRVAAPPAVPRHPGLLAYAVYTSGSTGTPKGVGVQHGSLLNLARAFIERHGFAPGRKLLMVPPLSFDASVGDVFPALAAGMTLVLHPEPAALGGAELLRLCAQHDIAVVDTAAALWRRWVDDLAGLPEATQDSPLRVMMVGGEAVPATAVREWAALTGGTVVLHNHYGPTEATVCATTFSTVDGPGTDGPLPIGRPLPNVRTYVLDADLRPVPVGVPGELYVGGVAPARGYLSSPTATASAFLPDPFGAGRMYRTGDLARLRPDGTLEFLGRADEQVKLRGNRIELAEVRAALAAHPQAAEVAVAVRDDVLVGYLVPRAGATLPGPAELRAFCAERLPEYMIPTSFVTMETFRLTRNGKIDVAALPAPAESAAAYEPPRTPVELVLAEVWAEVLGVPEVSRRSGFFALGGHSLVAATVLAKLRALLGVTLPLRALFVTNDLAELAEVIEQTRAGDGWRVHAKGVPSVEQMRLDAEPPADIVPGAPVVDGPAKRVLLTGATGFLGAHLLAELLARTEADVYCLVRAESVALARARLLANLRRARLSVPEADLDRVRPVTGDMAHRRLGLSTADYEMLAETVDAIYHNGAAMNFVLTYEWLMPPHVESMVEILRLAVRRRTKPLHLMSTLGVFLGTAYDNQLVTETDRALNPSGLDTGYNATKWVADTMGVNARDRGLPVSTYRIAAIVGDTRHGIAKADSYVSRLIAACAHQGVVPDSPDVLDMLPVDRLAAAIVGISTRHTGRDFHFYRADGYRYPDLGTTLNEMGYPVRVLPYEEWRQAMLATPTSSFGPLAFGLPTTRRPHPVFDCEATWAAAREAGVEFPPADGAMMRRHIRFLADSGVLPARAKEVAADADRVG